MSPWPEDVERVLERVVCGELAADAEEVRAVLARHPTAAAELEHLRAVQSSLGAFTADADEVVAAAQANVTAADRATTRRVLGRARPRWRVGLLVAAAAAALALLWWFERAPAAPGGMLGGAGIARVEPDQGTLRVVFDAALPPGGRYSLRLGDAQDRLSPPLLAETETPTWQLPTEWIAAARRARAPALDVAVCDSAGDPIGSLRFELSPLLR